MEQNNLPAVVTNPIDDIEFGNLIQLPRLYASGLITVNGAKEYTAKLLAPLEVVDITTVDSLKMEQLIEPLRENRQFLAEAKAEVYDARMPHTRKLDAMKSFFISFENDLDDLDAQSLGKVKAWEAEKIRRQRVANEDAQKAIHKATERASLVAAITNALNRGVANSILAEVKGMSTAYYAKSADDLTAYGDALAAWAPELDAETWGPIRDAIKLTGAYHSTQEVDDILFTTAGGLVEGAKAEYAQAIAAERDRLVTLIPSRINELNTVAPEVAQARIDKEQAAIVANVAQVVEAKAEVVSMTADNDRLNAVLTHAPAAVSAPTAKGTKVKQKYAITLHTAFPPIISNWVKNHLGNMTLEDALKKLSFMVTAANEDLNRKDDPITLLGKGLEVVEEVVVARRSSKKETAAA
jgi:hypothetical protein